MGRPHDQPGYRAHPEVKRQDQVIHKNVGTTPGPAFLPALGWCVLEPLPVRGWLIRSLRHDEDKPVIRVTLDLTDLIHPWVRVTGPNVSWRSRVRPVHAKILQLLAGGHEGLTPAQLQADLYGADAKTRASPEMTKLRKEFGGLLHPTSGKSGDNRHRQDSGSPPRATACSQLVVECYSRWPVVAARGSGPDISIRRFP
jgi:hypothetical protein